MMLNMDSAAYSNELYEEMAVVKCMRTGLLLWGSDAVLSGPDFDAADLGLHGDLLMETFYHYSFEDHHSFICSFISLDLFFIGSEAFWLTFQFGRLADALKMLEQQRLLFGSLLATSEMANGYRYSLWIGLTNLCTVMYLHGLADDVRNVYLKCGITFKNAEEFVHPWSTLSTFTELGYSRKEGDLPGERGMNSTER